MKNLKFDKNIIQGLNLSEAQRNDDKNTGYNEWATRVSSLEEGLTDGAYQWGFSWYLKVPEKQLAAHSHEYSKLLGFYGNDPQNPCDLGGEIEFWLEDEKYILTQSCCVFVPKGVKHSMTIRRVDKPFISLGVSTPKAPQK